MKRLTIAVLGALASMILSSCLSSDSPVFSIDDGEDIPGGTGAWVAAEDTQNPKRALFVRRQPDGSFLYQLGDELVTAIGVSVGDGFYLVQTSAESGDSTSLLVQVLPQYLIVYAIGSTQTEAIAAQFQLPVKGLKLPPGADKRKVKSLFVAMSREAKSDDISSIYLRKGGFIDPGNTGAPDEAQRLLANRQPHKALGVAQELADRGDPEAQMLVARIQLEEMRNSFLAVRAARQAFESGKVDAALLLAKIFWKGPSMRQFGLALPDHRKAMEWAATAAARGADRAEARGLLGQIVVEYCATEAARARNPDSIDCGQEAIAHADALGEANRALVDATSELVSVNLEILEEKEKATLIDRQREALDREEEQLILELCALSPADPRCR